MLISVVVATYNRPDALAAVLRSLGKQDDTNFEIVVADDGSGPETADVVKRAQATIAVPIYHVWQEDTGFRLAAARNRATAQANGDYLIYLDGDCLVRQHFVRAHRALAERGWCVTGGRVLLGEAFTRAALEAGTPSRRLAPRRRGNRGSSGKNQSGIVVAMAATRAVTQVRR